MTRIDTGDPDILEYREPIGWAVVVSAPVFVAITLVALYFSSYFLGRFVQAPAGWWTLFAVLFGLFMLYKWLDMANDFFVCLGVSVDRNLGTVTKMWGPFLPVPVRTYQLRDFTGFQIIRWTSRIRSSVRVRYYLEMTGPGFAVRVGGSDYEADIEAMAEDIARFMHGAMVSR